MHPLYFALINSLKQFAWIVGSVFIAGWVIGLLARCINNVYASFLFPRFGLYLFGLVGIPAHEFSHWIFCKVFRLKVSRVKWFDVSGKGGAHGMVEHQFDPGNPLHRFAHLFVGMAPILILPFVIAGLFYMLFPGGEDLFSGLRSASASSSHMWNGIVHGFVSVRALLFMYLAFALVAHMDLSREDLKVAAAGLPVLFVLLLIVNVAGVVLGWNAHGFFVSYGASAWRLWAPSLGMSLAISLMHLIIAWAALALIHFILRKPAIRILP